MPGPNWDDDIDENWIDTSDDYDDDDDYYSETDYGANWEDF